MAKTKSDQMPSEQEKTDQKTAAEIGDSELNEVVGGLRKFTVAGSTDVYHTVSMDPYTADATATFADVQTFADKLKR